MHPCTSCAHAPMQVRLYPELEVAMRHMAVQQETDFMVSEALRQLRLAAIMNKSGR